MKKILLIFLFFFVASTFAQKVEYIPKDYKADDFLPILKKININKKEKGEFETTLDYLNRIDNIINLKVSGNKTLNDDLYFQFTPQKEEIFNKYNADKKEYLFGIDTTFQQDRINEDNKYYRMIEINEPDVNEYFATFSVLAVSNYSSFPYIEDVLVHRFKLDVESAKEAKDKFSLIYRVKVTKPFTSLSKLEYENVPLIFAGLVCDIREIWIVHKKTGRIYSKIKPIEGIRTVQKVNN